MTSAQPRIEVLCIGDELLDGRVADTNTVRLAQALATAGGRLSQRTTVLDDIEAIVAAARAICERGTRLCIVSGGLGPTADDVTAEAFAALCGVALRRDPEAAEHVRRWLERRGREVTDNQYKQADRPANAILVANARGTAPGFDLTHAGCRFVCLPGVPSEFAAMVDTAIVAPLRAEDRAQPHRRVFCCFGLVEGDADRRVQQLARRWPQVRLGFRVRFPEIHISLLADASEGEAIDAAAAYVREAVGAHLFSESERVSFAQVVLQALQAEQATLAVAESCTGGLVADMLTDVPGCSASLLFGVVAYANAAKQQLLAVPQALLDAHGAVSEPVAVHMAEAARRMAGATYAVATTGIAGPGGATPSKPAGMVWLALATAQGTQTRELRLPFERRGNKQVAAYSALDLLRRHLDTVSSWRSSR